jgi:hypothetical protein
MQMPDTLYMYTDNCCGGDRQLFERCFSTLRAEGIALAMQEEASTMTKGKCVFGDMVYSFMYFRVLGPIGPIHQPSIYISPITSLVEPHLRPNHSVLLQSG